MNVNSNGYTFGFATVLVVVVAALLSIAAISLKPAQTRNVELEAQQNILKSINVVVDREAADEAYAKYIKEEVVIRGGQVDPSLKAFSVDLAKEQAKPEAERNYPLFVGEDNGETFYIIPVRGKGLWGPIWGYIALKSDGNTIYGATFDHKSETPGLGAEISTGVFQEQFFDKQIMEGNDFVSIEVRKGDASGNHQVDGISGGTITSVGLGNMLKDCLGSYVSYLQSRRAAATPAPAPATTDTNAVATEISSTL
jgi:Na+-transporting NADH:ubiquinone oxidoreductase subunit C